MLVSEKTKIEITNVEDIKDIANDFDILNHNEILKQKKEKEKLYEVNKQLIRQDLDMLKTEVMDRENLNKLREILEFIEKNEPNFSLDIDKSNYRDVVLDILNNFLEDLEKEEMNSTIFEKNNNMIDYNLIRDALKFISYMEESRAYKNFFEIYDSKKNLKNKLKEYENRLIGKLNHIVKVKQKKRRQELQKKKKFLTEEISKEFSKRNVNRMNDLLEEDFYNKKEESLQKRNGNEYDLISSQEKENNHNNFIDETIKQEVKQEVSLMKSKLKNENNYEEIPPIDIENHLLWNSIAEQCEQIIYDCEQEQKKNQNQLKV